MLCRHPSVLEVYGVVRWVTDLTQRRVCRLDRTMREQHSLPHWAQVKFVAGLSAWCRAFLLCLFATGCSANASSKLWRPFLTVYLQVVRSTATVSHVVRLTSKALKYLFHTSLKCDLSVPVGRFPCASRCILLCNTLFFFVWNSNFGAEADPWRYSLLWPSGDVWRYSVLFFFC